VDVVGRVGGADHLAAERSCVELVCGDRCHGRSLSSGRRIVTKP
jgi:hypothetical protein